MVQAVSRDPTLDGLTHRLGWGFAFLGGEAKDAGGFILRNIIYSTLLGGNPVKMVRIV
jgi:hypothetical protein